MASTTQLSVIKKFMQSLDKTDLSGTSAVDAAIKACSNSKFSSAQEIINQMITDCQNAGSADSFLKNYCGIILDNSDTGAITGSDVGGSTTKTAESVVPEDGDWKTFTGNSFVANGVTFKLVSYDSSLNYTSRSYSSLSNVQKIMWRGLYSWWGKEAVNLISESYTSSFGFTSSSSATTKTIRFGFVENDPGTLAWTATYSSDGYKTASDLGFAINMDYYSNLSSTNKNGYDVSSGQSYLDRNLAHEFTHAVMSANINYFVYLPTIIKEGMAELTHGIDDKRTKDIQTLAGDSSLLQQALTLDSSGYHYVSGVNAPDYAGGYMFLHYLAKQIADADSGDDDDDDDDDINYQGKFIFNYQNNTVISGSAYNDTVYSSGTKVTINGAAGDDVISSFGKTVKLNGESGDDYLRSYSNNSTATIKGGAGKDSLVGGGYNVKMYGGADKDYIYIYANDEKVSIHGGAGADEVYDGGTKTSVNGGAGNDYVHIYSGASNTTIKAGTGNDTIKSYSKNKVTYVYKSGDGKDVIDGFNFGTDKIIISSGKVSSTSYSGNDVILKIGSGSITVKDGKGKKITINGKSKTYGKSSTSAAITGYKAPSSTIYVNNEAALTSNAKSNIQGSASSLNNAVADTWFTKDSTTYYDGNDLTSILNVAPAPVIDTNFKNANPYSVEENTPILTYVKAKD